MPAITWLHLHSVLSPWTDFELIIFTVAHIGLFRICDEQSWDKTEMFSLLLRSGYQSQSLVFSSHHSLSEEAGGGQEGGKGHSWDTSDLN